MADSLLFLLEKDTNATATEQGFYYQKLKTLTTWLRNRLTLIDEDIYCDHQEDIFQRNATQSLFTYRQVKLYASNFSFSSDEINKTLINFFFLFLKQEDQHKAKFIFETNSAIAKDIRGNDADLLKEWFNDQGKLNQEQLAQLAAKVKTIISEHIDRELAKKTGKDPTVNENLLIAKEAFDALPDELWQRFIKCIEWKFELVDRDEAIPILQHEAEEMIAALPLPLDPELMPVYMAILIYEITTRTAQNDPEDRKLNNRLLDFVLLNSGSKENRWYVSVFEKWNNAASIQGFITGQFFEVISAARHCRWHLDKSNQGKLWLDRLSQYIALEETPVFCKRKAIYEYLWLLLLPDPDSGKPKGNLFGQQEYIHYYFRHFEHRNTIEDVEDDITLLQLVQVTRLYDPQFIDAGDVDAWITIIDDFLDQGLKAPTDVDERCKLLELKGHLEQQKNGPAHLAVKVPAVLDWYRKIIPHLKDAGLYNLASLNEQLNQMIKILIRFKDQKAVIKQIEAFQQEILTLAQKPDNDLAIAKNLLERGMAYLRTNEAEDFLEALDYLHQSSMLWYQQDTKDGFISVMVVIAGLYAKLGMNFAAKYYTLCAVFASKNFGDARSLKRISDAAAMLVNIDFRQGAWFSALNDLNTYVIARLEFNPNELDLESDSFLGNFVSNMAAILAITPKIHPEMRYFIQFFKATLGWLYKDYIAPLSDAMEHTLNDDAEVRNFLQSNLTDQPLNDVGAERTVSFNGLGIDWVIEFVNTPISNAIGEEFCSALQIVMCEIGLSKFDGHFLQIPVHICITANQSGRVITRQRNSLTETAYEISIPVFQSQNETDIKMHYAQIGLTIKRIFCDLSLLPAAEIAGMYGDLLMNGGMGRKVLSINGYQKVYLGVHYQEGYDQTQRANFNPLAESQPYVKVPEFLVPENGLSPYYNKDAALGRIREQYAGFLLNTHVSLAHWQRDPAFQGIIKDLRQEGWLDWQILAAMADFLLHEKATQMTPSGNYNSQEDWRAAYTKAYAELKSTDEKDCYMQVPAMELATDYFGQSLLKVSADLLEAYGLQKNMDFPNFAAFKTLLDSRFNFSSDDFKELRPFDF